MPTPRSAKVLTGLKPEERDLLDACAVRLDLSRSELARRLLLEGLARDAAGLPVAPVIEVTDCF